MKPIAFPQSNCNFAANQEQYQTLPALKAGDGAVLSCWSLTVRERVSLLLTGRLWLWVQTFGQPLQPIALQVENPFDRRRHGAAGRAEWR